MDLKSLRLSVILAIVVLMLVSIAPALAQTADFTTTFTRNAIIRSGPDSSFDQLGVAQAGTAIRLDGRNDNGNWVRGITSNGVVGWVSSGTINITLAELGALRPVSQTTPFTLTAPAAPAPPPAMAPATSGDTSGNIISATTNVNMRSGPGTTFARVGGVTGGAPINVDGRDAGAGWVRGINQAGVVGWVSAPFTTISPDALAALPVVGPDTPVALQPPPGAAPAEAAAAGAPIVSTSPIRGFSYGGHIQNFSDTTFNAMRRSGMTWIKKQWRYFDGQDVGAVQGWIDTAHANGFRLMVGVVGQPGELLSPGYMDRYAGFVAGLAARGVDAIEVWNEPNIDREWPAGHISPAMYTNLLRVSYNAIKGANPNTLVVSGAPAPTGFFGGCSGAGCDDNLFLAGMAAAGAASYMDCIGIHYNEGIVPPNWTSGDPRGASGHYTRYLRPMMDVYYNAFRGSRPLCFTELGYLTPEGYGPLPPNFAWASDVTLGQQVSWLAQAVNIARNSGRVRVLIIWNVDFTRYDDDPMAGYAMIRPGGACPACDALGR